MIPAQELRIGNWVLFSPSGRATNKPRPVCVKMLLDTSCLVLDGGTDLQLFYESAGVQPIPLTAEVLEKCGFRIDYDSGMSLECGLGFTINFYARNLAELMVKQHGDNIFFNTGHVLHLHQLQNLYFALTGTELEIKL